MCVCVVCCAPETWFIYTKSNISAKTPICPLGLTNKFVALHSPVVRCATAFKLVRNSSRKHRSRHHRELPEMQVSLNCNHAHLFRNKQKPPIVHVCVCLEILHIYTENPNIYKERANFVWCRSDGLVEAQTFELIICWSKSYGLCFSSKSQFPMDAYFRFFIISYKYECLLFSTPHFQHNKGNSSSYNFHLFFGSFGDVWNSLIFESFC